MKYEAAYIAAGRSSVGIEFGSTRIKAVAIGEDFSVLATGVRAAYAKLAADVFAAYAKAFEAALQVNGVEF